MSKSFFLTALIILASAIWLLSIGLFLELSQHDPYSWAFPSKESDLSRSLFLARRDVYIGIGIVSFIIACSLGGVRMLINRRLRNVDPQA
jgi:hypothetical protein